MSVSQQPLTWMKALNLKTSEKCEKRNYSQPFEVHIYYTIRSLTADVSKANFHGVGQSGTQITIVC